MPRTAIFLAIALLGPVAPSANARAAACLPRAVAASPLLEGVGEIAAPGVPGTLAVWGDRARVLVEGKAGRFAAPVVAVGSYGAGRVVAFGHTGYCGKGALDIADTRVLLTNSVRWAAGGKAPSVLTNSREFAEALGTGGITGAFASDWHAKLGSGGADEPNVVVITGSFDEERVPALAKFVSRGGGLILCQTGWGWKQGAGAKPMTAFAANKVLAPAGIAFTDDTAERTSDKGFRVGSARELCHALAALDAMAAGRLTDHADLAQAEYSAMSAARVLPLDDHQLRPRLDDLLAARRGDLVPTEARPLTAGAPLARVLLAYDLANAAALPLDMVRANPAAQDFPGPTPARVRPAGRIADIRLNEPGRYSTGMYALPGSPVTLAVGGSFISVGLGARLGCHSDTLWHKDEWKRVPEITLSAPFDAGSVGVASPFGGLVYFELSKAPERELPLLRANITGAIPAPYFVLGKTRAQDWVKTIRQYPAPWAELATSKVIVTVPSETIRSLENPDAVLKVWDAVMDAQADLAALPHERARPERIVADRQISAGYMHSGYPIMTHLDAAPAMVSAERLKEGQWGLFHELGHNHQNPDWTFEGTGEVTCNLFSLYTMEKVCGKGFGEGHDALKDWKQKAAAYMKGGAKFEEWKKDPFLALSMYMQLAEAFGWDTYKKVFAEYNGLKKEERPKNDDEKRDQWMVRFSRACGKNLGPFFEAWGVPTSSAARDSIKDLSAWMPERFESK